jgi:hypothetical protein
MARRNDSETLRALAEALAPYLREIYEGTGRAPRTDEGDDDAFEDNGRRLVADLPRELTEYALVLFEALKEPPHRVDLATLSKRLGAANGREVSGMLLTPLKRRAARVGFSDPPWRDDERPGGYRVLEDPSEGEMSGFLHEELLQHHQRSEWAVSVDDLLADPEGRRPMPSSIYVWAPEYVERLEAGVNQESSCLRTDHPGTRAVIYQAHENQGIVALFDVCTLPEPNHDWNYTVTGRVHLLTEPIRREQLLEIPRLRSVFAHIQGRRRIPQAAQVALTELLLEHLPRDKMAPLSLPVFETLDAPPPKGRRARASRSPQHPGRTARP